MIKRFLDGLRALHTRWSGESWHAHQHAPTLRPDTGFTKPRKPGAGTVADSVTVGTTDCSNMPAGCDRTEYRAAATYDPGETTD